MSKNRKRGRLRRPDGFCPVGEGGDSSGGQQSERAREKTSSEGISRPHGQQVHHDDEERSDFCQGGSTEEEAHPRWRAATEEHPGKTEG